MTTALRALTAIVVLALAACTNYRTDFEKPDVKVTQVQHLGGGLLDQRFRVQLTMTNPNDYALDLKAIQFQVAIADKELINGVAGNLPKIPAYGQASFSVDGQANVLEVGSLMAKVLKNPSANVDYQVNGTVSLRSGFPKTFPLQKRGTLSGQDWLNR